MKIIPVKIPNRDAFKRCYVDDEDYSLLKRHKWSMTGLGYPKTRITVKKVSVYLSVHRIILWCPDGMVIDHIDGNPLNNQKKNLRICTQSQNCMNKRKSSANKSGHKGVSWSKRESKWLAQIMVEGKVKNLGRFKDKKKAAEAYRAAADKHYGEFAKS